MSCNFPLTGYRLASGDVVFVERGDVVATLELPCGQCAACRQTRAAQWTVRIMHEYKATLPRPSYFVTLTYDAEHLPPLGSLRYEDVQRLNKALRKRGFQFRFFCAGEYGENLDRPHFHVIYFGLELPDLRPVSLLLNKHKEWRSALLESLWGKGHVHIGTVTPDSAAYVAGYALKKITGDAADAHYAVIDPATGEVLGHRVPEFSRMSLRPGIGAKWFERFYDDFKDGTMMSSKGEPVKLARFYDKRLKAVDPDQFEWVKGQRVIACTKSDVREKSDERRKAKDEVIRARQRFFSKRA